MKIAVGTRRFESIAGHAGRTRDWLVFDTGPCECTEKRTEKRTEITGVSVPADPSAAAENPTAIPAPRRIVLQKEQLIHHFGAHGEGPHPLDGVELILTGSAGEGFFRHMEKRGARVRLTGETAPHEAVRKVLAGEALAPTRFDITTMLCKVHDLFSSH